MVSLDTYRVNTRNSAELHLCLIFTPPKTYRIVFLDMSIKFLGRRSQQQLFVYGYSEADAVQVHDNTNGGVDGRCDEVREVIYSVTEDILKHLKKSLGEKGGVDQLGRSILEGAEKQARASKQFLPETVLRVQNETPYYVGCFIPGLVRKGSEEINKAFTALSELKDLYDCTRRDQTAIQAQLSSAVDVEMTVTSQYLDPVPAEEVMMVFGLLLTWQIEWKFHSRDDPRLVVVETLKVFSRIIVKARTPPETGKLGASNAPSALDWRMEFNTLQRAPITNSTGSGSIAFTSGTRTWYSEQRSGGTSVGSVRDNSQIKAAMSLEAVMSNT
jgi:hypothetical protein